MISLLDIVGPVMVGPSSSHTAGACRLARVARTLLEEEPVEARFELHSAFAKTMRGHGTDRALVAGALGMEVDDPCLKDALDLAVQRGLKYALKPKNMGPEAHPNSVAIHLKGKTRTISILGASIGGGMIEIREVDGFPVSLSARDPCLLLFYDDRPGMVMRASEIIGRRGINIASMEVLRRGKGELAFMRIDLDAPLPPEDVESMKRLPGIRRVHVLDRVAGGALIT
ncbi:MAG: L-serine ammonia-lyase, iron-sulfur-dependent subunit beta [Thermoanaerobaculia bacterium]